MQVNVGKVEVGGQRGAMRNAGSRANLCIRDRPPTQSVKAFAVERVAVAPPPDPHCEGLSEVQVYGPDSSLESRSLKYGKTSWDMRAHTDRTRLGLEKI
jgi:hypothetical protein